MCKALFLEDALTSSSDTIPLLFDLIAQMLQNCEDSILVVATTFIQQLDSPFQTFQG
jgi:hypothetical protein